MWEHEANNILVTISRDEVRKRSETEFQVKHKWPLAKRWRLWFSVKIVYGFVVGRHSSVGEAGLWAPSALFMICGLQQRTIMFLAPETINQTS